MNENEARKWLIQFNVSRETLSALEYLEAATIKANAFQNLIARSTAAEFWNRHIIDSAQLLFFLDRNQNESWIDLGSGAGFPGLVVALLSNYKVTLAEVRRKRADHLAAMVSELGLGEQVHIEKAKVEHIFPKPYAIISARAFAPLERLFATAHHLSDENTVWLLPKGRSAASELEAASRTWQGSFRIEPSVTDPEGAIIVATDIQPRRRQ